MREKVLLQAVLAALPTYTMSCFKLPLSICKQIQSLLTRFWWDAKPEIRKLCWVSWSRLTRPKSAEGLGFRETKQFNNALLAKLAWRILKEPQSFLASLPKSLWENTAITHLFLTAMLLPQPPTAGEEYWREEKSYDMDLAGLLGMAKRYGSGLNRGYILMDQQPPMDHQRSQMLISV